MASISGMDYNAVQSVISELEAKKSTISGYMDHLISEVPSTLASAYSGEAADSYKNALTKTSTNIQSTMNEIIKRLSDEANQRQAEYEAKTRDLAESTSELNI